MKVSDLFKEIILRASEPLKDKGYVQKGNFLYLWKYNNCGVVNFQKSRKSTSEKIIFTINVGIFSSALQEFFSLRSTRRPSIEDCQWRERIGYLLPDKKDQWWGVHLSDPLDPLVGELGSYMSDVVVPAIDENISDEQLSREWMSGRSPGLTDIQRLINLSALLKLAHKDSALSKVMKELEEKSSGKATESMVKQHMKHLKQASNEIQ